MLWVLISFNLLGSRLHQNCLRVKLILEGVGTFLLSEARAITYLKRINTIWTNPPLLPNILRSLYTMLKNLTRKIFNRAKLYNRIRKEEILEGIWVSKEAWKKKRKNITLFIMIWTTNKQWRAHWKELNLLYLIRAHWVLSSKSKIKEFTMITRQCEDQLVWHRQPLS